LLVDIGVKAKHYGWNVAVPDESHSSTIRICNVEIFANLYDELEPKFKVGWIDAGRGIQYEG